MRLILLLLVIGLTLNTIIIYGIRQHTQNTMNASVAVNATQYTHADTKTLQTSLTSLINTVGDSVVNITVERDIVRLSEGRITDPIKNGGGSGILIHKNGYILTNTHVVDDTLASYNAVLRDGRIYNVRDIRKDPAIDMAVLRIEDPTQNNVSSLHEASFRPHITLPHIGQFSVVVGHALGQYKNSMTLGIISGRGRSLEDVRQLDSAYIGLLQTDAAVNPGNSGGPLFDIDGNVIGIITAIDASAQGVGFAIPINASIVKNTLQSINTHNDIRRPYLGILYEPYIDYAPSISRSGQEHPTVRYGVKITSVAPLTPGSNAGLRPDDIITSISFMSPDDTIVSYDITPEHTMLYLLYSLPMNTPIILTVKRNNTQQDVELTPLWVSDPTILAA